MRVKRFFADNGIEHENSPPYEHESNGVAERFNRNIVTKARALLLNKPKFLWAEAISTTVYLYNRTPHKAIDNKLPIELLNGETPSIAHLHVFGQRVYVHIPEETRHSGSKLQPRAIAGIFVGYTRSSKIYRIYIPEKRIVQVTRQVTFLSTKPGEVTVDLPQFSPSHSLQPFSSQVNSQSIPQLQISQLDDSDPELLENYLKIEESDQHVGISDFRR